MQGVIETCGRAFAALPIARESLEAVLLNQQMAGAYGGLGDAQRFQAISLQTAEILPSLPFCEELSSPYHHVIDAHLARKEVARAATFIAALRSHAQAVGNLRAQAKAEFIAARTCSETGRFAEALACGEQALTLAEKAGDAATIEFCLCRLMSDALVVGEVDAAADFAARMHARVRAAPDLGAEALMLIGRVYLAIDQPETACALLAESIRTSMAAGFAICAEANLWLGRAYQRIGQTERAIEQFQIVLQRSRPSAPSPQYMPDAKPACVLALAALDELLADRERLAEVCRPFWEGAWRGEPFFTHADLAAVARPDDSGLERLAIAPNDPAWRWDDPNADSRLQRDDLHIAIRAAGGRDLWWTNSSAPRLVHAVAGDFSMQVICRSNDDVTPAIGGLLVWQDEGAYLRLDRGSGGAHEVAFMGCIGGVSLVVGRGRLADTRVILRLVRRGNEVAAYCSADGRTWYTLGRVLFPAGLVSAGLFAVGLVDWTIYSGVHGHDAQVCFELDDPSQLTRDMDPQTVAIRSR